MPFPMFHQALTTNDSIRARELKLSIARMIFSGPIGQSQAARIVSELSKSAEGQKLLTKASRSSVNQTELDFLRQRAGNSPYAVNVATGQLRFGDGLFGKGLPSGAAIQAAYRVGGGRAGNFPPR